MSATTITTSNGVDPSNSTFAVLLRAVAAERIRLTSLRSTWWSLLGATLLMVFFAVVPVLEEPGELPIWLPGELGIAFVQFALYIPALLMVTADHGSRAIHTALLSVPRRVILGAARLLVAVVATTTVAVLLAGLADGVAWMLLGDDAVVVAGEMAASIGAVATVVAVGTAVVVGVAFLLRSTAGTVTVAFLSLLVLPALLPEFGRWAGLVGEALPGAATMSMLQIFGDPLLDPDRAAVQAVVWVALVGGLGILSLARRDA